MELRDYWRIIKQRWWIPVLLTIFVGVLSALQLEPWRPLPTQYQASMRLLVGVMPATEAATRAAYDPRYYAWLTSEYLVDDFTEVVRSQLFAQNVSARLADRAIDVAPGIIQGSAATGQLHRIITLDLQSGDPVQLEAMADAAATELIENATTYFQALGTDGAGVTLIDGPSIRPVAPSVRSRIDLPLRMLVALLLGLGLVFLLNYMDTSIRSREELAELDLTVLGEIPKH